MNAHPMITPLTAMSPEFVAETYPPDASALYRLLWDTTLAYLKGPPTWRHTRIVFGDEAYPVAMDWAIQDSPGWLAVHSVPTLAASATPSRSNVGEPGSVRAVEQCTYSIVVNDAASQDCRIDALLGWAEELQIASPNRLSTLLEGMSDAGLLFIDDGKVAITAAGIAQLDRAKEAGYERLTGRTLARWRVACDDYACGSAPLESLTQQAERLLGVSAFDVVSQLETLVTHGHAAEDTYALRNQKAARPPIIAGYPRMMDPELVLRSDDPLRVQRVRLERELSDGREQQWAFLSADERVSIRLGFLASSRSGEALTTLADEVRFDVRVRWLVGLSPNSVAPDIESAKKAFSGWMNLR